MVKVEPINLKKCYITLEISCIIHTFCHVKYQAWCRIKKEAASERQLLTKNQF